MTLLWILRSTVEIFCLLLFGAIIVKSSIHIGKAFLAAFLLGNFVNIVRMLPLKFGIHTIFCIITILLIYHDVFKLRISRATLATFYPLITLTIVEFVYFNLIINLPFEKYMQLNEWDRLLCSLPPLLSVLIITGLAFLISSRKVKNKLQSTSFSRRGCT